MEKPRPWLKPWLYSRGAMIFISGGAGLIDYKDRSGCLIDTLSFFNPGEYRRRRFCCFRPVHWHLDSDFLLDMVDLIPPETHHHYLVHLQVQFSLFVDIEIVDFVDGVEKKLFPFPTIHHGGWSRFTE